jgi:ABC-type amino acid transport system permease subunit
VDFQPSVFFEALTSQAFVEGVGITIALTMVAMACGLLLGLLLAILRSHPWRIVRAAGQRLAARALGMPPARVFRRVIAPQLVRVTIPPLANDFITMLKLTSLASAISLQELLARTESLVATTFRFAEYYSAAAIYYLVLVSVFMVLQAQLERRYVWASQGGGRSAIERVRGLAFR